LHFHVAAVDAVAAGPALLVLLAAAACRARAPALIRATRRALAHRADMEQFVIRGVARKKERTGILIFVSMAERYARIIADEGIDKHVSQSEWQEAVDALVEHTRDGRIADGFVEAIDRCGRVLATHFPRTETSHDELPDRIYVL
jgi:putative membrane protein